MKNESYIKLFRKITEWEHYTDGNTMRVFLHLLILATHDEQSVYDVALRRGQCFSSSRKLQTDLKLCAQYVSDSLKKLEESGEIKRERCNFGTIFTIVNYDEYQGNKRSRKDEKSEKTGSNPFEKIGTDDW